MSADDFTIADVDAALDGGARVWTPGLGAKPWERALFQRKMEREARKAREREDRKRAEYMAELDAEIDAERAAESAPRAPETVEGRLARIEDERRIAAMTESERRERFPFPPKGAVIRAQDRRIRRAEREAAELAEREQAHGVPRAQKKWEAECRRINEARAEAIRDAQARCKSEEQAARERAESELTALGARPSLEAVAA